MTTVPLVRSYGPLFGVLGIGSATADLLLPDRRVPGRLFSDDGTLCFDADDDFTFTQVSPAEVETEIGQLVHRFRTWATPGRTCLWLDWPDELDSRDRRRFARVQLDEDHPYALHLVGAVHRTLKLTDISVNGASFVDDQADWSPGDRVEAEVRLDDGLPSRVLFDVRAVVPLDAGVVRVHGRFLPIHDHGVEEPLSSDAAAVIEILAATFQA